MRGKIPPGGYGSGRIIIIRETLAAWVEHGLAYMALYFGMEFSQSFTTTYNEWRRICLAIMAMAIDAES